jgi:4-hydroxybenzoate polyprenyltransferase
METRKIGTQLKEYGQLMRLHRPIGILLLLWPTLWALWIAGDGQPEAKIVIVFVLGVMLMRSAGCVINDYADREFDPHVKRTQNRPLAAGRVRAREAITLFLILCMFAFGLVLLMNWLTILLSLVAIVLATSYPFMKRYIDLPQIHLGMAFGWAVPMAFAAQTGEIPPVAWLMLLAVVLWAIAYDTIYAMVDREDDIRIGVRSSAILFGNSDRWLVAAIQMLVLSVLVVVGRQIGLGGYYYAGLAMAASFLIYQQWLIRDRSPEQCFRAFVNNNWVGAAVFAGLTLDFWF